MPPLEVLRTRLGDEAGASMVEYAFMIAGIALVVFIAAEALGIAVFDAFGLPLAWL